MKFSIITPLYNKSQYIGDTINSVLSQSYTDFELIVVDDSSTDNSVDIVNSFIDSRIHLYTKPNGGVSAARNFGIGKAKGEIICFLDADDIWDIHYLKELSNLIIDYPDCGFFCGAYKKFIDTPNNVVDIYDSRKQNESDSFVVDFIDASVRKFGIIGLTSSVSVKMEVLRRMDHWFDTSVCRGEDVDMWVRISLITKTVYNNKPLMFYRLDATESLMNRRYNFNYSFNYWKWYDYGNNKSLSLLASQRIYSLAKNCYKQKMYREAWMCLSKIRYSYLFLRRIILSSLVIGHLILYYTKRKQSVIS